MDRVRFLSAALVVSPDPARLASFYRDALGIPLQPESHGDTALHYGCELGDVHFAIHPAANFPEGPGSGGNSVCLAFAVDDLGAVLRRCEARGVLPLEPPRDVGFAILAALRDPDGNYIELTQLSAQWIKHLRTRRTSGEDPLGEAFESS